MVVRETVGRASIAWVALLLPVCVAPRPAIPAEQPDPDRDGPQRNQRERGETSEETHDVVHLLLGPADGRLRDGLEGGTDNEEAPEDDARPRQPSRDKGGASERKT